MIQDLQFAVDEYSTVPAEERPAVIAPYRSTKML